MREWKNVNNLGRVNQKVQEQKKKGKNVIK